MLLSWYESTYLLKLTKSHIHGMEKTMTKKTISEKEQELLDIISSTKDKLSKLQQKQKIELGSLACKHGLHQVDKETLNTAFKKLAKELNIGTQ
jgi:hypothetical protein